MTKFNRITWGATLGIVGVMAWLGYKYAPVALWGAPIYSGKCSSVLLALKETCLAHPERLLSMGRAKSSSIKHLNISRSRAFSETELIFQPRKDTKAWKVSFPIQWDADPFRDRNWRMHLHSWRLIDQDIRNVETNRDSKSLRRIVRVIRDWFTFHFDHISLNRFPWYDMSVAYRADRLSKILDLASEFLTLNDEDRILLIDLAGIHVDYLMNPRNLSIGNHGVFEMAALSRLCRVAQYVAKCADSKAWSMNSLEMLTKNQFGSDGLQREHSFGYHFFMTQIYRRLLNEGVIQLSNSSLALLKKADAVEPWLVTPEGFIPPVGETDSGQEAKNQDQQGDLKHKLFGDTGLAVVRTPTAGLWFFAFHHSHVHKQDDDLAVYLWDNGEPLLIDAGKFSYDDRWERDYVLGRTAHNTVTIPGLKSFKHRKPYGSGIKSVSFVEGSYRGSGEIKYDQGVIHARNFEFHPGSKLILRDHVSGSKGSVTVNFLLSPKFERTDHDPRGATFHSERTTLTITALNQECDVKTHRGVKSSEGVYGWYSPSYRKLDPTWAVSLQCPSREAIESRIEYGTK